MLLDQTDFDFFFLGHQKSIGYQNQLRIIVALKKEIISACNSTSSATLYFYVGVWRHPKASIWAFTVLKLINTFLAMDSDFLEHVYEVDN